MAASRPTSLGILDILPIEIREEVYSRCSPTALGIFARVSCQAEQESAFLRLLSSIINAEPESYQQKDETRLAAIAILKRHPELLFKEAIVTDHVGRPIKATPYQLFLGAGDIWALKQVHKDIIPKIENGEDLAQAQFRAQFPECKSPTPDMSEEALYDKRNKEQIEQVKKQLEIIVAKITADPCTDGRATLDETREAVDKLRKILAPKEGEVIEAGLHFPLGIMQEIFKVYDAQFNPWSPERLSFYSREVIGSLEAALTAVDGQCFKHGLNTLNLDQGPDRRDGLFCAQPKGIPLTLSPLVGKLGVSAFVSPYGGWSVFQASSLGFFDWYDKNGPRGAVCGQARAGGGAMVLASCARVLSKLMSSKNSELGRLMRQSQRYTPKRNVGCIIQ